jgi:hypothetical protein
MKTFSIPTQTALYTINRKLILGLLLTVFSVVQLLAQQLDGTNARQFTIHQTAQYGSVGASLKLYNERSAPGGVGGEEQSWTIATDGNNILQFSYLDDYLGENRYSTSIHSDGRIGIGDAENRTPQALLHVDSRGLYDFFTGLSQPLLDEDILNRVKFTNESTGNSYLDGFGLGIYMDGTAVVKQNENKDLHFSTNATNRMTIENDGQVSIGNPASVVAHPNAKLTVDGAVFISPEGGSTSDITSIAINSEHLVNEYLLWVDGGVVSEDFAISQAEDWADFVFEKGYELRSLEEVETHIQDKGHLPTIPSAEEVKNGYNLHQMNKQMLQTIEELTLHTIEQNKQIKALLERVEQLEQK